MCLVKLHDFIYEEKHNYSYTCTIIIVSMAYISYKKSWENEINGIVSKRHEIQDSNNNQPILEVHETYKKDERKQQTLKLLIIQMV